MSNRRPTPYAALWFLSGGAERNSPAGETEDAPQFALLKQPLNPLKTLDFPNGRGLILPQSLDFSPSGG